MQQNPKPIQVIKADGGVEEFSLIKISNFLSKIQLPEASRQQILSNLALELPSEVSTEEISRKIEERIAMLPNGITYTARYLLKPNMRKMGPEGHIFEQFIGRLFTKEGYTTRVAVEVHGKCAAHEVDVVASKEGEENFVECKFHNKEGTRSDITVAMYSYARFLDIEEEHRHIPHNHRSWLATNTKLTIDGFKYVMCKGMNLLNFDYPEDNSLVDQIIRYKAYPVSSIVELSPYLPQLFKNNYLLVEDIANIGTIQAQEMQIPPEVLSIAQGKAHEILKDI